MDTEQATPGCNDPTRARKQAPDILASLFGPHFRIWHDGVVRAGGRGN
jgi:hypothetical protein